MDSAAKFYIFTWNIDVNVTQIVYQFIAEI